MKNNELLKVNSLVWETDISNEINAWEEFINTNFCNTKERKDSARKIIKKLNNILNHIKETGCVTRAEFDFVTTLLP